MTTSEKSMRPHRVIVAIASLLTVAAIVSQFVLAAKGDKNWLLLAATKWLAGNRLYTDIFEVNPPYIVWLFAIPSAFAKAVGIPANIALVLMVLGLVVLSLAVCLRLMHFHPQFANCPKRQWYYALLLEAVMLLFVYPTYFADREHIFIVLALPYLMRFLPGLATRTLPLSLRIVTGVMGGLGFCIKPHLLVIFIAVQFESVVRNRSLIGFFCIENGIICGMGVGYIILAWFAAPEYFTLILPMALATYGAYKPDSYIGNFVPCLLTLAVAFADARPRAKSPYRSDLCYWLWLCAGSVLYAWLNNGWGYTFIPLQTFCVLAAGWLWWEYLWLKRDAVVANIPSRRFSQGATACAIVFTVNMLVVMLYWVALSIPQNTEVTLKAEKCMELFDRAIRESPEHSFGGASMSFYLWPELATRNNGNFSTRYNHFWMLPKFQKETQRFRKENEGIITWTTDAFAQDLTLKKPGVVFVENHAAWIMDYLNSNAAFVAAWSNYSPINTPHECGYTLFKRN